MKLNSLINNEVKIIVYNDSYHFLNYLVYHFIKYKELIKNKDYYILVVSINDYKKISKRYKTKIIKYYGIRNIINIFYTQKYFIISFLICLFILNLLTNTIFDIKINVDDDNLRKIVLSSLKDNGISIYKRKKSYDEIELIKESIIKSNDELIEWMGINEIGCTYEINITKKVLNKKSISNGIGDIISTKDGVIKHIVSYSGTKKKEINEYVKKGEVLISGNIYKNDKVIDEVKASGNVYAEVWYTAKVSIPLEYIDYVPTGKVINHYYINLLGKDYTIIGKYDSKNTISTKELLLNKPYLLFKLFKESKTEYEYKTFNLNENEAYNEAIIRSENYINSMLNDEEYIISKNTLKKGLIRSKIYVEVFFKVYENIGVASNTIVKEELNEKSTN